MSSLTQMVLRGLQVFFGIIILGLSASLVATQAFGSVPSATNYNVFLGIWILAVAVLGFAAGCLSIITAGVMTVLDVLSVLFTFVGGVVYAAQIGISSCACNDANSSCPYLVNNNIINGGLDQDGLVNLPTDRVHRCQSAQADTAFMWVTFGCFVCTLIFDSMRERRGEKL